MFLKKVIFLNLEIEAELSKPLDKSQGSLSSLALDWMSLAVKSIPIAILSMWLLAFIFLIFFPSFFILNTSSTS